jgi:hypothetical protein
LQTTRHTLFNPLPEPEVVFVEACRAQALSDPCQIISKTRLSLHACKAVGEHQQQLVSPVVSPVNVDMHRPDLLLLNAPTAAVQLNFRRVRRTKGLASGSGEPAIRGMKELAQEFRSGFADGQSASSTGTDFE